jgi:MFS family permease
MEGGKMYRGLVFRSRWWVVFGATLSMVVAQGPVILYTLGLFIKPLNQDFGWDRASISAAGGLAAISSAIAIPFVGWLIDQWGIRTILLPVVVLSAFSIALLALRQTRWSCSCCSLLSPVCWDRAKGP